jgi:two-component system, chemotaxis family, CheB/CheR fusion protein
MVAALRVLLVEDDADSAATLARFLRGSGHEVQVSADGATALKALETFHPDAVLLDLGLPDIDGWRVAQQIWKQAGLLRPLLIAVSGYSREEHGWQSHEAGIDLHLVKPVDLEQLNDLLSRHRAVLSHP